ncbi:hypothetical protein V8C40DRAFT_243734, partial [Trichoderma camerunense]
MEYIWTRPLTEKSPTTLGADRRVSIASSCFGSLSLLFSKLILFFIALLLSILSSTYETFFFLSILLFRPLLTLPSAAAKLLFFIFYDSYIYPPLPNVESKKKAARRGGFFFLSPFFRLRSTVFFRPCVFFLSISSLAGGLNGGEGQMCTYANCSD